MRYANNVANKEMRKETLNRGASFLVAPHNLTFDKKAIIASETSHNKVIEDLEKILSKHKAAESKRLEGLSADMIESRRNAKGIEIIRTEALLNKFSQNLRGQLVNGRKLTEPDV